jgi:hypothetical protein
MGSPPEGMITGFRSISSKRWPWSLKELLVGRGGGPARDRAVVDDRRLLAVARAHVPVERVDAGVELPVGEPAIEGAPESSSTVVGRVTHSIMSTPAAQNAAGSSIEVRWIRR